MANKLPTPAQCEIGSLRWHLANCRAGECVPERVQPQHQPAVYATCAREACPPGTAAKLRDAIAVSNVIAGACSRRRL